MQLGGVDADRAGQLGHSLGGERRQGQSRRRAAGQLAEDDPQRVARIELVVAIGDEHQRGEPLDAPSEQAQDVERGLVGPVEVLEDDDVRRPRAQRSRQRPDEGAGSGPLGHRRAELAAHLVGDVHEGAERARGEERVARAPQDSALTRSSAERPHERRLADPRLTGDQHEPSAALFADRDAVAVEGVELGGALEQLHRARRRAVAHRHMFAAASARPPAVVATRGMSVSCACAASRRAALGRRYPNVKA